MKPQYLSVSQFARKIGCSPQAVHYAIMVGLIEAERIGWSYAIPADCVWRPTRPHGSKLSKRKSKRPLDSNLPPGDDATSDST
jgi:hypothetical protein